MTSKTYISKLVAISLLIFSVVIGLNFLIDPLAKFRLSSRIYYSAERELKPKLINSANYDGIILGNSKVTYIQPEDLQEFGKILNAGFSGATIEEIRYLLDETNPRVKWIAIGLDFFMFSSTSQFKVRNGKYFDNFSIPDQLKYVVSTDTLRYSVKSISKYFRGVRQRYTPLGARNKKYLENRDRGKTKIFQKRISIMRKQSYQNYRFSENRLKELQIIKKWADKKGITLVAWINPYEEEVFKIVENNIGKEVDEIFSKIRIIIPNVVNLSLEYKSNNNFWKNHPVHFYPSVGTKFFSDRILPVIVSSQN